ncbi:MAG TPA: choice-of-anchor R domain-containing protein [Gemmatimonas sp.]|uniref:choice-of-anchor R domain-containing protein n=1 Tax=Gemmatimonas sp. TaxID=1962908 RepID=UPI002ED7A831
MAVAFLMPISASAQRSYEQVQSSVSGVFAPLTTIVGQSFTTGASTYLIDGVGIYLGNSSTVNNGFSFNLQLYSAPAHLGGTLMRSTTGTVTLGGGVTAFLYTNLGEIDVLAGTQYWLYFWGSAPDVFSYFADGDPYAGGQAFFAPNGVTSLPTTFDTYDLAFFTTTSPKVPEPASGWLLLSSGALLYARRLRQRTLVRRSLALWAARSLIRLPLSPKRLT